jgi:hypothetical protein
MAFDSSQQAHALAAMMTCPHGPSNTLGTIPAAPQPRNLYHKRRVDGMAAPTCLWELSDDLLEMVAAAVAASREAKRQQQWLASWVSAEFSRMDDSSGC